MASFSVVSNITAAYAQTNLQTTQLGLQKALSRLSSGYRINQAGDDAAGLSVANGFRNDAAILNQGIRNANDGLSALAIKDGALSNITTLLDRLATLATQGASVDDSTDAGTATLAKLDKEYQAVKTEIGREANIAGLKDGGGFSVFISRSTTGTVSDGQVTGSIDAVDIASFSISTVSDIKSTASAQDAVAAIAADVATLGGVQSQVGSLQNALQFAISLAQSQLVNTQAAESRIRDANVAQEAANMTRYNILNQSGVAALAQANQSSASVLSLLR